MTDFEVQDNKLKVHSDSTDPPPPQCDVFFTPFPNLASSPRPAKRQSNLRARKASSSSPALSCSTLPSEAFHTIPFSDQHLLQLPLLSAVYGNGRKSSALLADLPRNTRTVPTHCMLLMGLANRMTDAKMVKNLRVVVMMEQVRGPK